jgi:hypothetical protein
MRVMGDHLENLLEDSIAEELRWLRQEFDFLFRFKKNKFSQKDIELANSIIDSIISRYSGNIDDKLVDLLSSTVESIVSSYPDLL